MIPEPLTTIKVTLCHCVLYATGTSTDPNIGIDSPEYEQSLFCEGEKLLSGHNSLKVLSDIRDSEASVTYCVRTVMPSDSASNDAFQGVTFPSDVIVMFNSWYSLTDFSGFLIVLHCLLLHTFCR